MLGLYAWFYRAVIALILYFVCKSAIKSKDDVVRMEFTISQQWDSRPTGHDPIHVTLTSGGNGVTMKVEAPFFNDPPSPPTPPGEPAPQLWDYEVVEAFFLNDEEKYLEVELCPHGQHLVLLLNGTRNAIKDMLPLDFTSEIKGTKWVGTANIPANYFPPKVSKFNAYAIHGSGEERMYESLYPTPEGKYTQPDFHRLDYFRRIDLSEILPSNYQEDAQWVVS